jgi:Bacterial extracellular solute-binding proteins, family 3
MKTFFVIQLLFNFWIFFQIGVKCDRDRSVDNSKLIKAVEEITKNIFALKMSTNPTINLVSPESSASFALKDFTNDLLPKSFLAMKFTVRNEEALHVIALKRGQRHKNIFVIEDFKGFLQIYAKIVPKNFKLNGHYLIVLINGQISEIQEMFKLLWKFQIFNVNVMFEDENGEVLVKTFMPFNVQNCNDTTPILISKFKNETSSNDIQNFFPEKLKNLHKCPIRISLSNNSVPFTFLKLLKNGSYKIEGIDILIIDALSKQLNFKMNFSYIDDIGYFYENGTAKGPLKALLDSEVDVSISGWWLKPSRMNHFSFTTSYLSDRMVFMIPPGRELTSFEKLVHPFTTCLWTLIIGVFVFGFTVIFVIKRQKKVVQNFVFGTGVRTPYLNMFIAFIGGVQKKLPGRNFARFLLMMFLMYSLVMRTLYQASFYQILKSNKQHEEVQSIDEIIEKDFKFFISHRIADLLKGFETIQKRLILIDSITFLQFIAHFSLQNKDVVNR